VSGNKCGEQANHVTLTLGVWPENSATLFRIQALTHFAHFQPRDVGK